MKNQMNHSQNNHYDHPAEDAPEDFSTSLLRFFLKDRRKKESAGNGEERLESNGQESSSLSFKRFKLNSEGMAEEW
ncbi:MAG: hypothetical protein AAB316_18860 [Bacteroidota bacterium]